MAAADLASRWPLWPEGEEGRLLLDVVLDLPVDQAFLLLYGGLNELSKTFNEAVYNKEYSTTAWMEGAEAVQSAAVGPTPPPLADVEALRPGLLRRASYSGTMMGSKYRNEELHRLQEAAPGTAYSVLTTVLTTAMHGEKFRPVVLTTLTALPDGRTEYRIRSTIVFIIRPNGFIKAMIDKGARDGQRKNFEALRRALEAHTTVREAADALEQPAAAAPAAVPAAPEAAAVVAQAVAPAAPPASLLEAVVGADTCHRLRPWAAFLHARLAAVAPVAADLAPAPALLAALAVLSLLSLLRLVVDMLLFIQHASAQPKDSIGLLTHLVFKARPAVVDVPESMQEVLLSCLIFYTVRLLINRLADMLPAPPVPDGARRAPTPAAPSPGGSLALAAAPSGGLASALSGLRSEEQEAEGIKYEGYAEAIAAAQAQQLSPTTAGAAAAEPASGAAADKAGEGKAAGGPKQQQQQGGSFMAGFTKSISGAFTPSRTTKERAATAAAVAGALAATSATAATSGNVSGAVSPAMTGPFGETLQRSKSGLSVRSDNDAEGSQSPAALAAIGGASAPLSPLVGNAAPTADVSQSPLAVPRSLSESAAALGSGLPPGVPVGPASPRRGSLLKGSLPPGAVVSPPRSLSPPPDQGAGDGLAHSKSQGLLVEQSGSSMSAFFLGKKSRGMLSPTAQPTSPERKSGEGGLEGLLSPDQMLSPTAAQREFRPAMPAHLAPELAAQAVIEEVFENQRLQPFRGWGHSWPGHFLPTDKVNHWSRREQENFPVLAGSDFQGIAPPLPEGWQWCEEKWHLDLSAQIIDACDAEGWSYGLDFGFVRHPFQPNSGKKKMSDFVRRRRWIRTRVPLELAAQRATAISADSTSWTGGRQLAAGAAVDQAGDVAGAAGDEGEGERYGGSAGDGGTDDELQVQRVVQSMFAEVVARSELAASMQQALAHQIGTSSGGSGGGIPRGAGLGDLPGEEAASGEPAAVPDQGGRQAGPAGKDAEWGPAQPSAASPGHPDSGAGSSGAARPSEGREGQAGWALEAGPSLRLAADGLPLEGPPAAALGSSISFSRHGGGEGDDLLVSPSQQLRGFRRSTSSSRLRGAAAALTMSEAEGQAQVPEGQGEGQSEEPGSRPSAPEQPESEEQPREVAGSAPPSPVLPADSGAAGAAVVDGGDGALPAAPEEAEPVPSGGGWQDDLAELLGGQAGQEQAAAQELPLPDKTPSAAARAGVEEASPAAAPDSQEACTGPDAQPVGAAPEPAMPGSNGLAGAEPSDTLHLVAHR